MAGKLHAALCPVSYSSSMHVEVCISYICLLCLSSIRCICMRGKDGDDALISSYT